MAFDGKGKYPGVVYLAVNRVNGKAYIGKCESGNIRRRWQRHTWIARTNPQIMRIALAINKHGAENFDIAILGSAEDKPGLLALESKFIAQMGTRNGLIGYNDTNGGDGAAGYERTREHRELMANRLRVRWANPEWAERTKRRMKGSKVLTVEQREAISRALKAKNLTGPNSPAFGRKATEEQRRNLSAIMRLRWADPAYRSLQSVSHRRASNANG